MREDIELRTEDGLTLVGELALPASGQVDATLSHAAPAADPRRLHGLARVPQGRVEAPVPRQYRRLALQHPRHSLAARHVRAPSAGAAPRERTCARLCDFAVARGLPHRWLLGWSFGTELALMHGANLDVEGAVLLSPPLHRATEGELEAWAASGKPVTVLVPEFDDYLRPDAARHAFAPLTQATIIAVDGAKHLWVGEPYVRRVLDEIVAAVAPAGHAPLPTHVQADVVAQA